MASGAQLSVTELRRSTRHPVQFRTLGEHRRLGDIQLEIVNISAHGFMATADVELGRGERIIVRLPHVGRIEAHLIWTASERSGYQFERIIRLDDFTVMIRALQPNARLRRER